LILHRLFDRTRNLVTQVFGMNRSVQPPLDAGIVGDHDERLRELGTVDLGECVVFSRFAFTTGKPAHPNDLARRCLSSGVGISAVDVWGETRVGPGLEKAFRRLHRLERTAESLTHPGFVRRVLLVFRHPILVARGGPDSATALHADGNQSADSAKSVEDIADAARRQIVNLASIEGSAAEVDQDVVRPNYLASEPWVRLSLPPVTVRRLKANEEHTIDVSVLLHRSGEAVMTFGQLVGHDDSTLDSVNAIADGTSEAFVATRLDRRLLELYARSVQGRLGGRAVHGEGRPEVHFDHASAPVSLGDIFNVYREAVVVGITGKRLVDDLGEFLMVPMLSVRGLSDALHPEVGPLLATHFRAEALSAGGVRVRAIFQGSRVETWASDVWVSGACVVQLFTDSFRRRAAAEGEQAMRDSHLRAELAVGLAVDLGLLRLRMLETFSARLSAAKSDRLITEASRLLFVDYDAAGGDRLLRVGELADVETAVLNTRGFENRRESAFQQRELARTIAAANEAVAVQQSGRRTQQAVILLTIVVATLGFVGVLLQLAHWNHHLPHIRSQPFQEWGPWVLVGLPPVLLVVFLVAWAFHPISRRLLRWRARPLGRKSPPKLRDGGRLRGGGIWFGTVDDARPPGEP
jgi:hypothetical protein